jgi:hypothetical protein
MRTGICFSLLLLLTACFGSEPAAEPEPATPFTYFDANAETGAVAEEKEEVTPASSHGPGLAFKGISLGPERVTVLDTLYAEAKLRAGSSAFAEVDFIWFVNDREVRGVSKPQLSAATGRFKKGDVISVRAEAIDERGQIAQVNSSEIVIANSIPVILNDISRRSGINGLVMEGEDADGDPIAWSILSGPPGVTINARGRVTVTQVDLAEAFSGEVVIAGTDPEGARAELHVPVSINAAVEEVIVERTTTRRIARDQMTDEDYERINLEGAERVLEMTEQEFDAHSAEQERREEERNKELGKQ